MGSGDKGHLLEPSEIGRSTRPGVFQPAWRELHRAHLSPARRTDNEAITTTTFHHQNRRAWSRNGGMPRLRSVTTSPCDQSEANRVKNLATALHTIGFDSQPSQRIFGTRGTSLRLATTAHDDVIHTCRFKNTSCCFRRFSICVHSLSWNSNGIPGFLPYLKICLND